MVNHFLAVDEETIKIIGITLSVAGVGGFIVYLCKKLFDIFISNRISSRQEFRAAYTRFSETFTPYLQQLENRETNLNTLIVNEFERHDLAMRNFVRHLSSFRKKRFDEKWSQYKEKHDEIQNLGTMGFAVAIAPPEIDITQWKSMEEMQQWDNDRRQILYGIIEDLLHIASKRGWF